MKICLEESRMSQPAFCFPHVQYLAKVELFIPFPPPNSVFLSIAFQTFSSICCPPAHEVLF